jgi:DNA-binding transcriptional LysR family regulator
MDDMMRLPAITGNADPCCRSSPRAITIPGTVDLRHLEVFVAVAEEASFSRAADRLHVVQSAVSATIRKLEREWGVPLFHRTTHSVALSTEGRALLPEARAALDAAAAVGHAVDEVRGGLRGTLRLGIMQRGGTGLSAAAAIAAFRAEHPGVDVEVRQGASAEQAERVRAGELDVAFIALPDISAPGLELTTLLEGPLQLATHATHRLAQRGTTVDLKAVADEPFCDLPPAWGIRLANDRAFAAAGLPRRVDYEINDVSTVIDFVRHGLAITITTPAMADLGEGIALIPIRRNAPRLRVSLATPATRRVTPAARAFTALALRHAIASAD